MLQLLESHVVLMRSQQFATSYQSMNFISLAWLHTCAPFSSHHLYIFNSFCPVGSTAEGAYTGLNTRMRYSLPSSDVDASTCITTSIYEELHEYEEMEPASKF